MTNEYTARENIRGWLKHLSVKVVPEGQEFTLASGQKSRVYVDVRKTAMSGMAHGDLGCLLYNELSEGHFGAVSSVAGVVLGGCHLASIAAAYGFYRGGAISLNVVYVRKEPKSHGTQNLIEGPPHLPNEPIVLLEDVVTTGGSSLQAMQELQKAGYAVRGTVAVIDRRVDRSPTLGGFPFRSLFTIEDVT